MQKRTLSLSLLLASLLLIFSYSFASAQSISFEDKTVPYCSDAYMNITVTSGVDLSAFEVIFEVSGDFASFDVALDPGLPQMYTVLDIDGNVVRLAGVKADEFDVCLPSGSPVVGTIHFVTADICNGTISVAGTTVDDPFTHGSVFVGCDPLVQIDPTVGTGTVTVANQLPTIVCPDPITVHWGTLVEFDVTGDDPDLVNGCENLTYTKVSGPGTVNPLTGHYSWATGGEDVCDHIVVVRVTDKCGATAECSANICVYNDPPEITFDPAETLYAVLGVKLEDDVVAGDTDGGPSALHYTIVSFDGPTSFGTGLQIDALTGHWSWDIADDDLAYTGDWTLCLAVDDGANVCDPCSPTNADTACYAIHVSGFKVAIECEDGDGLGVLQNHATDVSVSLEEMPTDPIGGFDFLIAYDASALTALDAQPGALIDGGKFEYFTYRFGPFGNCDGGCPSGLLHIVGLRETNNGIINPNPPVEGPGELAVINFFVTNDRNLECQFIPVRFFWIDCGDNTLSDVTGNILYLGLHVYDYAGDEITDPVEYGYSGPLAECYDTVSTDPFKAPLGAILFKNCGVKIICADSIDARGDVNLNGIAHEVADAVVFTNYFIYGSSAFSVNLEGQIAATEVNGDGIPLSVADLVYLIRVVVGDVLPITKLIPGDPVKFVSTGNIVSLEAATPVGAALFVFDGNVNVTLADNASHMDLKQGHVDGTTRVLVYGIGSGLALDAGQVLQLDGKATLVSVEAADYNGSTLDVERLAIVPTEFALKQNYPNPFNPQTIIELALPTASNWKVDIYDISGRRVAEFGGFSEAGTQQITWDASGMPSGMYLYKATAGSFKATKKMLLLK